MSIHPNPNGFLTHRWQRYLWGLVSVTIATGLSALIHLFISPTNLVVIYLLCVVFTALYLGRGPAILNSILSVLAFDFFFVPPSFTLAVSDTQYLLTFLGLFVVGLIISQLTARVREQVEAAQRREAQTTALYELGRDLTVATGLDSTMTTIIAHIGQTLNCEVVIFLLASSKLEMSATSQDLAITEKDLKVARWVFDNDQLAGYGTGAFPETSIRFQPLRTTRGVIGVLGVKPPRPDNDLTSDQRRTLDTFANQVALAVERASLVEQARQTELLEATEKLQTALLNSISHDLRTPLVSITGALSSLAEDGPALDHDARCDLIDTAREEADRLNRLVGNLLSMTRLEAGAMYIHHAPCDIQEVIGSALEQIGPRLDNHQVNVDIPPDMPLVQLDFVLIGQVLVNVIENAVKYSPPDSAIDIQTRFVDTRLEVSVADRGVGIPPEDLTRIFNKFYRVQRPGNISGTGLGLSISKGIVEAHGGSLGAENRPGGGTIIRISLPTEEVK